MNRFRCKKCGRLFESVPRICECGNDDLTFWEIAPEAPEQPEAAPSEPTHEFRRPPEGGFAPAAPKFGEPVSASPASPVFTDTVRSPSGQPAFVDPLRVPPAYPGANNTVPGVPMYPAPRPVPPPPSEEEEEEDPPRSGKAAAVLLSILLVLMLTCAGVLGYFTYQAWVNGVDPLSYFSEESDEAETDGKKNKTGKDQQNEEETSVPVTQAPDANVDFIPVNVPTPPAETKLVKLPDFTGTPYDVLTQDAYYGAILRFGKTEQSSPTVPAGEVMAQSIPAGSLVNNGTALTLTVSIGPQKFTMPDVSGKTYEAAAAELSSYQLKCEKTEAENPGENTPGTVKETVPAAGAEVTEGDAVQVIIWGEPKPEPAPAPGEKMRLYGVTVDVPDGFTVTKTDTTISAKGCDGAVTIFMSTYEENIITSREAYGSDADFVNDVFGMDGYSIVDYGFTTLYGHDALLVSLSEPGTGYMDDIVLIQVTDSRSVQIEFEFFDVNHVSHAQREAVQAAYASIAVE